MGGELGEILKSQELRKFFENDIYYAVYRQCFKEDSEQFCDFLNRFGCKRIYQRDLVDDPHWQQTYKKSPYMFEHFRQYLVYIRSIHPIHWKQISHIPQKKHQK